jgi:hypothetical protein
MTRTSLNKTLRRAYVLLTLVLLIALAAKLADHIPGVAGTETENIARDVYEWLKDMSLVFVTVVAAYLANVFQKRSKFVESLEEEWRSIVRTKSALLTYCENTSPTLEQYLTAFMRLSDSIDTMRIAYKNSGETTKDLLGLYPYEPLHDMRRAIQTLDPRLPFGPSDAQRELVRDSIVHAFNALRENFLSELDLEEPSHPLLVAGGRRTKTSGAHPKAHNSLVKQLQNQKIALNGSAPSSPEELLRLLHLQEKGKVGPQASSQQQEYQARPGEV